MGFFDEYNLNTGRGPHHVSRDALPQQPPEKYPARFIAYYLPQFHAIPENDRWWGTGFTEWTNVTKALPRYVGHYQPRLPADLGFYDLSAVETLERQAELARRGGIFGFCIHDYWFDGQKVLDRPLELLLSNPQIDIRFCLNWANENWTRRWDGLENEILLKQNHSVEDDLRYAASLEKAFRDERYIRIGGRPLLMLYRPGVMPDARATVSRWREYFTKAGLGDPYIVMPQAFGDADPRVYGMDAAAGFLPHNCGAIPEIRHSRALLDPDFSGTVLPYPALVKAGMANRPTEYRLFPGVCPDWDNDARKPGRGTGFWGSTPQLYGKWLNHAARSARRNGSPDEAIVFINAWNEWAEGAYLEPDRHFGFAYLAETRRVLDRIEIEEDGSAPPADDAAALDPVSSEHRANARGSLRVRLHNRLLRSRLRRAFDRTVR